VAKPRGFRLFENPTELLLISRATTIHVANKNNWKRCLQMAEVH